MADITDSAEPPEGGEGTTRRDFLYLATAAVTGVGLASFAWPLIDSMNPAADVLALATIDVDLSPIAEGQGITVVWRGKPVFVRRRTAEEIEAARSVALDALPDPEADQDRVQRPEWLVVIGICTHLGCIPQGQEPTSMRGEYGGYFCSCHGSQYDTSGRIRKGPAPSNLAVPPYQFVSDTEIRVG